MIPQQEHLYHLGNPMLLHLPKTAFLCSRQVPAEAVLRCYDWAIAMRDAGRCIVGGFHSPLEKDVLYYLLKGKQPVIMVLARGMKQRWEKPVEKALAEGRLLIATPFGETVRRADENTAAVRNDLMLKMADDVVVGYASPEGMLMRRLRLEQGKKIEHLTTLASL